MCFIGALYVCVCVCVCERVCVCGVIVIVNSCVYEYYYDRCDILYIICTTGTVHTRTQTTLRFITYYHDALVMNV